MAIKIREYEVRLTRSKEERRNVRRLRYDVFVLEEGARPSAEQKELREEWDRFDDYADYMAVFHRGKVVGTYRIIDRDIAEKGAGFYTETEFNINKIRKVRGNIAEMSRACVAKSYRDDGLVMRMLWLGLGDYILKKKVVIVFGVASWVGVNPAETLHAISYLYYNHLAPISLRATVKTENFGEGADPKLSRMKILPREFVNDKKAREEMTPLIKGYLRLGSEFGNGVFIDMPFNSYDVFVQLQTKKINGGYQKRFAGKSDAFKNLAAKSAGPVAMFGKLLGLPFVGLAAIAKFILQPDEINEAELVADEQCDE
jgi:putative hemolysin